MHIFLSCSLHVEVPPTSLCTATAAAATSLRSPLLQLAVTFHSGLGQVKIGCLALLDKLYIGILFFKLLTHWEERKQILISCHTGTWQN